MTTERSGLLPATVNTNYDVSSDADNSNTKHAAQYSAIRNASLDESDGRYVAVDSDDNDDTINIVQSENKINNCQTLIHLVKTCMGSAILLAPNTFSDGGLWVGLGGVLLCGFLVVEGMQTLVRCSNRLMKRVNWTDGAMDFGDVAEYTFKLGPRNLRLLALPARFVVKLLVVIIQLGTCSMYFIFVPSIIKGIVHQAHPNDPTLVVYMAAMLAIVLPYSLIKSLRHLAIASAVANILLVIGYGLIMAYIVADLPSVGKRPAFESWDRLPSMISKAVFTFEGIGSILPLMSKMHTPEDFGGFSGVLLLGMIIPISIYSAMGFYGYLRYGDSIHDIITLNLPQDHGLTIVCEIMVAVAILLSFGIQFYVPVVQMWPWIAVKIRHQTWKTIGEYIFRIVLVLLTFGFAVAIPHLDLLLALFGAVAGIGLGLIIPPLLDLVSLASQIEDRSLLRLIKNIAILIFGITICLTGTYTSLREIILTF